MLEQIKHKLRKLIRSKSMVRRTPSLNEAFFYIYYRKNWMTNDLNIEPLPQFDGFYKKENISSWTLFEKPLFWIPALLCFSPTTVGIQSNWAFLNGIEKHILLNTVQYLLSQIFRLGVLLICSTICQHFNTWYAFDYFLCQHFESWRSCKKNFYKVSMLF